MIFRASSATPWQPRSSAPKQCSMPRCSKCPTPSSSSFMAPTSSTAVTTPRPSTHHQYLRDRMVDAIRRGVPVFVSESAGMEASGNGPLDPVEWQAWIDCMEQHKVSWVTWSLSDKDETCSMLLPRATATGPWKDDVIKKSGKMLRDYLRRYNP